MIHGVRNTYARHKCRCEPCTMANRIYTQGLKKRLKEERPKDKTFARIPYTTRFKHGVGTETTVTNISATWRQSAACVGNDPRMWDIDNPDQWSEAMTICSSCPVRQQCGNDGFNNPDAFGVYSGVPLWAGVPMEYRIVE